MTKLKNIKAFAFDVDGVFTGGGVLCDLKGELYRTFDSKDGFGVRMAVMHGFGVAIITGGRSLSIKERFLTSGVAAEDIYLGARNKIEQLEDYCKRHGYSPDEIMFVGDDIPDIGAMKMSGIGLCPSDACEEVIKASDIFSDYPGGHGCVRNAIEMVLKAQGKWTFDPLQYKKLF